jgi:hypothetical protein
MSVTLFFIELMILSFSLTLIKNLVKLTAAPAAVSVVKQLYPFTHRLLSFATA